MLGQKEDFGKNVLGRKLSQKKGGITEGRGGKIRLPGKDAENRSVYTGRGCSTR